MIVRVVIAIVAGSVVGLWLPDCGVRLFKACNALFAQLLKFMVSLLILGLVTPAIAALKHGGVLMSSIGFLESIIGMTPDQTALLMTIYMACDYGTACNVVGDGAIAIFVDSRMRDARAYLREI